MKRYQFDFFLLLTYKNVFLFCNDLFKQFSNCTVISRLGKIQTNAEQCRVCKQFNLQCTSTTCQVYIRKFSFHCRSVQAEQCSVCKVVHVTVQISAVQLRVQRSACYSKLGRAVHCTQGSEMQWQCILCFDSQQEALEKVTCP